MVASRQLLVLLITTGVVESATVKDITASVATVIGGNSFFITETKDLDHQFFVTALVFVTLRFFRSETGHGSESANEVKKGGAVVQFSRLGDLKQILKRRRDAVKKIFFALEEAAKSVGTKYLQQAEGDNGAQLLTENGGVEMHPRQMFGREFLNLVQIVRNHFFTQFGGEGGGCLPEEGGNVIRHRTTHAALEIYEERSATIALTALNRCLFPHDIARLKVSVHKPYVLLLSPESAGKTFKIILQKCFVHRNFYRFEKAIFEVV